MATYKIKYRVKPGSDGSFDVVRENRYSSQSWVIAPYGDHESAIAVARILNGLRISELGAVDENPILPRGQGNRRSAGRGRSTTSS